MTAGPKTIAERIREARAAKDVSQADLAKAVGLTQPSIANWERGKAVPTSGNAESAARFLGVDVEWLVYGKGAGPDVASGIVTAGLASVSLESLTLVDRQVERIVDWVGKGNYQAAADAAEALAPNLRRLAAWKAALNREK